jgi:hypothetical protein
MRQEEVDRLTKLGIYPDMLAGRLRLVLTIGCYNDFRFTRDILCSGGRHEQMDLGANCDCEVFRAVGQLPRGVLWHHSSVVSGRL